MTDAGQDGALEASRYFGVSVETLLNVYGHHHPDHLRDAAEKMGRRR